MADAAVDLEVDGEEEGLEDDYKTQLRVKVLPAYSFARFRPVPSWFE